MHYARHPALAPGVRSLRDCKHSQCVCVYGTSMYQNALPPSVEPTVPPVGQYKMRCRGSGSLPAAKRFLLLTWKPSCSRVPQPQSFSASPGRLEGKCFWKIAKNAVGCQRVVNSWRIQSPAAEFWTETRSMGGFDFRLLIIKMPVCEEGHLENSVNIECVDIRIKVISFTVHLMPEVLYSRKKLANWQIGTIYCSRGEKSATWQLGYTDPTWPLCAV